jgi:hypothetical protein
VRVGTRVDESPTSSALAYYLDGDQRPPQLQSPLHNQCTTVMYAARASIAPLDLHLHDMNCTPGHHVFDTIHINS